MSHCFSSFTLSLVWCSVCWLRFLLRSLWLDDFFFFLDCVLGMASGLSVGWIWMMSQWLTALSSPAAPWEATGLQDLGKCCFLFLGYGCALGKPGFCCYPCSEEARQGLGWFGFREAGASNLWSRSCSGLLSITRSSCGQSGVQGLKTCFTRCFIAEACFWAVGGRML